MDDDVRNESERPSAERTEYEPPAVEEMLSADDLAREVHYAGDPGSPVIG